MVLVPGLSVGYDNWANIKKDNTALPQVISDLSKSIETYSNFLNKEVYELNGKMVTPNDAIRLDVQGIDLRGNNLVSILVKPTSLNPLLPAYMLSSRLEYLMVKSKFPIGSFSIITPPQPNFKDYFEITVDLSRRNMNVEDPTYYHHPGGGLLPVEFHTVSKFKKGNSEIYIFGENHADVKTDKFVAETLPKTNNGKVVVIREGSLHDKEYERISRKNDKLEPTSASYGLESKGEQHYYFMAFLQATLDLKNDPYRADDAIFVCLQNILVEPKLRELLVKLSQNNPLRVKLVNELVTQKWRNSNEIFTWIKSNPDFTREFWSALFFDLAYSYKEVAINNGFDRDKVLEFFSGKDYKKFFDYADTIRMKIWDRNVRDVLRENPNANQVFIIVGEAHRKTLLSLLLK